MQHLRHWLIIPCPKIHGAFTVEGVYFDGTFRVGKWYKHRKSTLFSDSCKSHLVQSSDNKQSPFNKDKEILCQRKKMLRMYQIHLILEKIEIFSERNLWKQFLFPIFILRCWMIFHPLLKSESFTSSTIDHTFSKKRRDSAELIYFGETFTTKKIYIHISTICISSQILSQKPWWSHPLP